MDYKQRYKEALERATKLKETCDSTAVIGWCEYLFPELKESEDDRIRKEMIMIFKGQIAFTSEEEAKKYISWLEKKGVPTEINPSEFDLRLNKLLKQFETLPKEELVNSLSFYLNVVQNDGTYKPEKQGQNEQILANSENTCKDAWSEEDEDEFQIIQKIICDSDTSSKLANRLSNWLKSLKQRMQ